MKKLAAKLFFGKDDRYSGLIAFGIIALIALGCTCGKNFDLGNLGKNDNTPASNTSDKRSDSDSSTAGSKPDASDGLIPPPEDQLQYLVRETMLDFNDAIASADFTDFHAKLCKPWQKQVTPGGMKDLFQQFIDGNASFGEIRDMDATFTTQKITKEGQNKILEVNGEYPTSPMTTTFQLNYLAEGKDWKLSKIRVETRIDRR